MQVVVDLNKCQDHGQCVFSAPEIFSLDDEGRLAFRRLVPGDPPGVYVSEDLDESVRDDVEEAADVCPLQAIDIRD